MSGSPPLRFLAVVLGGWAALRLAFLAPPWPGPGAGAVPAAMASPARPGPGRIVAAGHSRAGAGAGRTFDPADGPPRRAEPVEPRPIPPSPSLAWPGTSGARARIPARAGPVQLPAYPPRPGPASTAARRWSLSAWAFIRGGTPAPLAPGGLLGGSQAGARLAWRLNRDRARPLALSVRLSGPLERPEGVEAAVGIDWKPDRRLPVHLLAERRQKLGSAGRSAFAVTVYGGVSDSPAGPFRIDAYAQAGFVGARSRDPFADGSVRLSLPVGGRVRFGAGAWAAAQPNLARLDLGPQAAVRLPLAGRAVTLAADWRFRVAGDAEPGSGPTITLGTDF